MILDRILAIVSNVSNVLKVFESFQQGSIILQAGKNVIEVPTRREPMEVWISFKSSENMPVCNGDIDKVSYTILPKGFILYVDVVSDTFQLDWHAVFNIDDKYCKD